jgi:glycosyltransferase involved in cell wall biosynthesis
MKIALIHYRITLRGGLETRLVNYTNYLVEEGHEVTIVCAKNKNEVTFPKSVKIVRLPLGITPKVFRMMAFNHRIKRYLAKNNFDFSLSLGRTYNQDAVLAPSNHQGYLDAMKMSGNRLTDWVQNYLDRKTCENSEIIFAASSMIKEEMIEYYGAKRETLHVLFPPLNTDNFTIATEAERRFLRNKYDLDLSTKIFAFVSASHHRKGLDILLETFELLKDENVVLLIAGYPEIKTDLPNVRFLGFLKSPELIYHLADFTLHPARYEPFGQIISESLACGTPTIVSDKVGAKEIITPEVGQVLDSLDPKIWAKTLKNLERSAFKIPVDFVYKNGLSLEQHVQRMLNIFRGEV